MAGRPWRISREAIDKICQAREIGATYTICANVVGVDKSTFSMWLAKGRDLIKQKQEGRTEFIAEEKLLIELLNRMAESDAAAEIGWLQTIDRAAAQDPAWAEKQLRFRHPEDFSPVQKPQRVELTGKDGDALFPVADLIAALKAAEDNQNGKED